MAKSLRVMAVDLGASNGRCTLGSFDGSRITLEEISRFPNGAVNAGGALCWDILRLYGEIISAVQSCARNGAAPQSISVDSWAQDFALVSKGGAMLGNPRSYRDPYTAEAYRSVRERVGAARLFQINGMSPFSGSTLYQLAAQMAREPSLVACADALLFIPNLLYYFMSGAVSCDCTLASFSQLYDHSRGEWSGELISALGFPRVFPEAALPGRIVAETGAPFRDETGCRMKVALTAGHDTAAALYAAPGGSDSDTVVISSGTWSMLLGRVDSPVTGFDPETEEYFNALGADGKRIFVRGMTGLWILQECMRQWSASGLHAAYGQLHEYACANPTGAYFDPDAPELAQSGDMCGKISKLCVDNGFAAVTKPGDVYAVIVNSLARKYARVIGDYERVTGTRRGKIRIIGGGARNQTLNALTREHTGKQVLTGPYEAASIGNILLQLVALGEIDEKDAPGLAQGCEEQGDRA